MIWRRAPFTDLVSPDMKKDKRPRPAGEIKDANADIIIISDDEEPPSKKHRSLAHLSPRYHRPSSVIKFDTTISESSRSRATPTGGERLTPVKNPSPWKNQPVWHQSGSIVPRREQQADSSVSSTTNKRPPPNTNGNELGPPSNWTTNDDARLQTLSISQGRSLSTHSQKKPGYVNRSDKLLSSKTTSSTEDESEQLVRQFKISPAAALRFNPNSGVSSSKPTASALSRGQPEISHVVQPAKSATTNAPPSQQQIAPSQDVTFQTSDVKPSFGTGVNSSEGAAPSANLPKFSINVPLTDRARSKKERRELQERLKQGVEYVKQHPAEVDRILGLTGFSTEFPANLGEEKFRNAAQPKKRMVNRTHVALNLLHAEPQRKLVSASKTLSPVHPKDQVKSILTARFGERFNPPLTFSSSINDRRLNGKFQFVSEYILRKGVKATGHVGKSGCECKSQCGNSCDCLKKIFKDPENSKRTWSEVVPQYERRSDGLIVLRNDFMQRYAIHADATSGDDESEKRPEQRVEITECNTSCLCGESCINRVVQKGRTVPLEIFETARCGFGVRSSKNILRGQFIELYLGEVITDAELVRREEAAEAGSTSYVYSLDWFVEQQPYHIDGENFGSAMRFVNHSCDPNAGTFTVLNDKSTRQLHHVAFFAIKDITAGTEITIDYTPQAAGTTYELNAVDEGMERCKCGAPQCRKMLWLPGKERKARKKLVGKNAD